MILLYNSDELTVTTFDFFHFSSEEENTDFSEGTTEIILHDFDNDVDLELNKDLTENQSNNYEEDILEEENRRHLEIMAEVENIISSAKEQADEILKKAELEAMEIREKARTEGLEKGYADGYCMAYEENNSKLKEGTISFLMDLKGLIEDYKKEKDRLISESVEELKDVTVAIAEKVIQVSLKSSGEIIKKMIISATEKMRYKEWARIYISKNDSSLLLEGNTDLLKSIAHLSEHIKITAMEDAAPGTCIIELPDQVIDASTSTQIENIKSVLKDVDITNGGNDIV